MTCDPILNVTCEAGHSHDEDVRQSDNMLVTTLGVGDGTFRMHGDMPVVLLDTYGTRFIGEPNASGTICADGHSVVMIPVQLLRELVEPMNEAMEQAESRLTASPRLH